MGETLEQDIERPSVYMVTTLSLHLPTIAAKGSHADIHEAENGCLRENPRIKCNHPTRPFRLIATGILQRNRPDPLARRELTPVGRLKRPRGLCFYGLLPISSSHPP